MDKFKKMGRDAAKWAASPEGQKALAEAIKLAMDASEELRKKRLVTYEMLHRPFDI